MMGAQKEITACTVRADMGLAASWKRPGRIRLLVRSGPDQGMELDLDTGHTRKILGGRSRVNEIVLNDEHVSGTHFELTLDPKEDVEIQDLGSTNGVLVGGVRLLKARLGPGCTFRVGESVIELISADRVAVALSPKSSFGGVYGISPVMRELFIRLEKIASIDRLPTLLVGATGTGKELVARALHARSARAAGPFVAVNCATITASLAESFFFGQRKGSFTGAGDQPGCFEAANGGTLFLDEIAELPLELQPKLLRVLQERVITRIGEQKERKVDVRVISATHRDLRRMVTEQVFRDDLFFRLRGLTVELPRLSERADDIVPLADRHLAMLADQGGARKTLSEDAKEALLAHSWPGNVRDLLSVIETAYFLSETLQICADDLNLDPWSPSDGGGDGGVAASIFGRPLKAARTEFERLYLRRLLAGPGTFAEKAQRASISVEGLRLARKRLGID